MVEVGWSGQEDGEYEVLGNLPDYRMTSFRKLSDEIRLSNSQYSFCFFPFLLVFSPREIFFFFIHPLPE